MMTSKGRGRFSAHILKEALLDFFSEGKLYPKGMCREMECIQAWALRNGQAMQRLASQMYINVYILFSFVSGGLC